MRIVSSLLVASLLSTTSFTLAVAPAFAQSCTCPPSPAPIFEPGAVVADEPPPPLPDYAQPPPPEQNYLWTPGYWAWNGYEYYWTPGVWVEPPHSGLVWTPGYWGFADGVYAFHRGYWGEHVGFYGGVAYGFGYGGSGYEGGHWQGDRFFYNRAVTNVAAVAGLSLFDHRVPREEHAHEHVSFNGGPEGVAARPTEAELAADKETHVAPTSAQTRNQRVASRTESAFVSSNNGKPPVAATAHAGEFKGADVVPAKAAGGPLPVKSPEAQPEAKPSPKLEIKPTASPSPTQKPEPKVDAKPEPKPTASPTQRPEPKVDAKPEPKPTTAPTQRPEPKLDVKPEPKPTASPTQRPEPRVEVKPEPRPEAKPAPKPEARPGKPEDRKECGKANEPPCR